MFSHCSIRLDGSGLECLTCDIVNCSYVSASFSSTGRYFVLGCRGGGNLIYDEWYDTIAYDTFARRPMLGVHFQVTFFGEVCSRANKSVRRRQLFLELHVGTGDYVVTDDDGRPITNLDSCFFY